MIQKNLVILISSIFLFTGCSTLGLLGPRQIETVSKPIQIDIMQPDLPRPIELTAPKWFVVSEAKIVNPCKKVIQEDGSEQRPKVCDKAEKENPDWPDGYTYLDRFLDEMKKQNSGDIVFVATSVGDYKVMAEDMQELKRYLKQLGEVVLYYRNVTMPNGDKGVGVGIKTND
jgi:hypothetical protein